MKRFSVPESRAGMLTTKENAMSKGEQTRTKREKVRSRRRHKLAKWDQACDTDESDTDSGRSRVLESYSAGDETRSQETLASQAT